jgi:hypothetical protein
MLIFVILVMIQFTKQRGFSQRVGSLVVSGHYREVQKGDLPAAEGEYPLSGGVSLVFGGLEFRLGDDDEGGEGFGFLDAAGEKRGMDPELMILSAAAAVFRFPGGTSLAFSCHYIEGAPELRISGLFAEGIAAAEIPYRPLRSSRTRDAGDGELIIRADNVNYSFGRTLPDTARRLITLKDEGPPISYRSMPEKGNFNPADYVIPPAWDLELYAEALARWQDQAYSVWNRIAGTAGEEDQVISYLGESLRRGAFKTALGSLPANPLADEARSYRSSVYLGRLDLGLRSLSAFEREKTNRLSRLLNDRSPEFLNDSHVFEYFGVRGYGALIDHGAELIRGIDPSLMPPEFVPGILEGFSDWKTYRSHNENPFTPLIDQAFFIIAEGIRRIPGESPASDGDRVYLFHNDRADLEFNLRLGCALAALGEEEGWENWAALGRSLVLSVLSPVDAAGSVPRALVFTGAGEPEDAGAGRISAAQLYGTLADSGGAGLSAEFRPRALSIGAGVNGLWTWTAASGLEAVQEEGVLDIAVSFPVGEAHYMLIRGIMPFTKIQLYGIDYRTDPQFERYDSSGWSYSEAEQTLLLKMKHRTPVEHIRIFY